MTKQPTNKTEKAPSKSKGTKVPVELKEAIDTETKGVGRPLIEINQNILEKAETLASQGLTQKEIALCLGMGESTFYEKVKAYPEFLESIQVGQAKGVATIANAVFNKAQKGDMTAATFYLRNRAPDLFGDRHKVDLTLKPTQALSEEERKYADRVLDDITSGKAHH